MTHTTNEPRHPLASFITSKREQLGLSKRAVGIATGLSACHIGDIESGRRTPSADSLELLAKALRVSASSLARLKAKQQLKGLQERVRELEARAS